MIWALTIVLMLRVLCGANNWIQGLTHGQRELYIWITLPSSFFTALGTDSKVLLAKPGL